MADLPDLPVLVLRAAQEFRKDCDDDAADLSARLAAVRELHHPWPRSLGWVPGPVCEYDTELWPCPTARAIGES